MFSDARTRPWRVVLISCLAVFPSFRADAQEPMRMPMPDTAKRAMSSTPLGLPMDRMGSGTTWIPDAVSLPARHFMAGSWELMLHGFVLVEEDGQGGPRGASQLGSQA